MSKSEQRQVWPERCIGLLRWGLFCGVDLGDNEVTGACIGGLVLRIHVSQRKSAAAEPEVASMKEESWAPVQDTDESIQRAAQFGMPIGQIPFGGSDGVGGFDKPAMQRARAQNRTGLPDTLKSGVENLSGLSMDNVRVHYNSGKPAQMQAHAYTQGTDIHVAPGQEKHLPHEAWHVVQQAQGRVQATKQLKGVGLNDDAALEREADVMGARAMSPGGQAQKGEHLQAIHSGDKSATQLAKIVFRPYKADTRDTHEMAENATINADGNLLGSGQRVDYPNLPHADFEEIHLIGHGNQGGINYDGGLIWAKELARKFVQGISLGNLKLIRKIQFHSCLAADKSAEGDLKRTIVEKEGPYASVIERFKDELAQEIIKQHPPSMDAKQERKANNQVSIQVRGPYSRAFTHTGDNTSRVLKGWQNGESPNKKTLEGLYGKKNDDIAKAEKVFKDQTAGAKTPEAVHRLEDEYLAPEKDSHGAVDLKVDLSVDTTKKGWRGDAGHGSDVRRAERMAARAEARKKKFPDH